MTTKTAPATTADVDAEYRALALAASLGDKGASTKLMALEDRQDAMARAERRQAAAALEVQRLAAEAAEKDVADARRVNEARHAKLLATRETMFGVVENATRELAREVALTLALDEELWSASLACGFSPEQRTAGRIAGFIATALGREGSGLSDFSSIYGPLREAQLVSTKPKES